MRNRNTHNKEDVKKNKPPTIRGYDLLIILLVLNGTEYFFISNFFSKFHKLEYHQYPLYAILLTLAYLHVRILLQKPELIPTFKKRLIIIDLVVLIPLNCLIILCLQCNSTAGHFCDEANVSMYLIALTSIAVLSIGWLVSGMFLKNNHTL